MQHVNIKNCSHHKTDVKFTAVIGLPEIHDIINTRNGGRQNKTRSNTLSVQLIYT